MSDDSGDVSDGAGGDYRFRRGWSGTARLEASRSLRAAMAQHDGLIAVSEAAVESIRMTFAAVLVSIALMDRSTYRDIVHVGVLLPGLERFPVDAVYETSSYPAATRRLLELEGYISTDAELDVVKEYIEQSPFGNPGCFMGVPIVANGVVHGEIFILRATGDPDFVQPDLDVAYDMATQFGAQLPRLLIAHQEANPDW